jgi:hypothetical protein
LQPHAARATPSIGSRSVCIRAILTSAYAESMSQPVTLVSGARRLEELERIRREIQAAQARAAIERMSRD